MAAKRRHWKEKGGRFYARIAVPKALVPILDKTELLKSLGGDLRIADRNHPAAVARLQEEIARNRRIVEEATIYTGRGCVPVTPADIERAVWAHYTDLLRHALVLSRFGAAPLIAYCAAKETNYGTNTDGRIS